MSMQVNLKVQIKGFVSFTLCFLLISCSSVVTKKNLTKESLPLPSPSHSSEVRGTLQKGLASWYGKRFHRRRTASGMRFNKNALTAAHRTLPFGSRVRVTHLHNGKSVIVVINDRGPFAKQRIIDLSYRAARELSMVHRGVSPVQLEVL